MTTDDTGATKAPRTRKATVSPKPVEATAAGASNDVLKALKDAAHAVIGFGVIGWNKTQVHRRDLLKDFNSQVHQVETQLDGAKGQLATAIRHLDARIEPVRHDIDSQLDKVSQRLPEPVRNVVQSARKIARDTEHQVRQAVGAL
jgi:ElaB/YqjD/DUF883 family membrane-anchored ribosome-binding protein